MTTTYDPDGQLYHYNVLPMGVCVSLYAAQAKMERILYGLNCTVYLDDIGYWTDGTYDNHMNDMAK